MRRHGPQEATTYGALVFGRSAFITITRPPQVPQVTFSPSQIQSMGRECSGGRSGPSQPPSRICLTRTALTPNTSAIPDSVAPC